MTQPPPVGGVWLLIDLLRLVTVAVGVAVVVIGGTQIGRTLSLGRAATNADDVILRGGILIGVGAALLYATFGLG